MSIKFTAWGYNNMDDNIAIKVQGVSKTFKDQAGATTIKNSFIELGRKIAGKPEQHKKRGFTALKDINFEVKKGEFFGIVGRNGSGKSTLLKILAGVYTPTTGGVAINGSLTPFIELGVGFNPELTGKDNVYLNSALLGFSRKQTDAMYKEIVDFAELHDFMGTKLKNYSSGMQVRLAFSVAIRAESDILLIDEVLAVGDAIFQKKCYNYFKKLKKNKKTVVFVSHDTNALLEYCDRGLIISNSRCLEIAKIENIVNDYIDTLNAASEKNANGKHKALSKKDRWGTGEVMVNSVSIMNHKAINNVIYEDKIVKLKVEYVAHKNVISPVYGITITDAAGQRLFVSNTKWKHIKTGSLGRGQRVSVLWDIPNVFNSGEFSISPAVADSGGNIIYDCLESACLFDISKKLQSNAYINVDHKIFVNE